MSDATGSLRGCVVLAFTPDFAAGALVTLHSFLRHNRWFEGDVIVIDGGLPDTTKAVLETLSERVRFRPVSGELLRWIEASVQTKPELASQSSQFQALDVFTLGEDYDRVMFCDADLLFRGSVEEMWCCPEPLVCAADRPAARGQNRNPTTFDPVPANAGLANTFNSGLMVFDGNLLQEIGLTSALKAVPPHTWTTVTLGHTDQYVFNRVLRGRQSLVSNAFNYLLQHPVAMGDATGILPAEATVLHYNMRTKPWSAAELHLLAFESPHMLEAIGLWNASHLECLQALFLRRRVRPR